MSQYKAKVSDLTKEQLGTIINTQASLIESTEKELEITKRQLKLTQVKFIEFALLISDIEQCDTTSSKKINLWIDGNNEFLNKLKNERGAW